MPYIDGYVLPVPTKNLDTYAKMAKKSAKIWKEHGALAYCESVGDHLDVPFGRPFPKQLKLKPDESLVFAYVVFKSRADRDRINAKVMADPRLSAMCDPKNMPFDCKRMLYGGFKSIVQA